MTERAPASREPMGSGGAASAWWKRLADDPFRVSIAVLGTLVVVGFVAIGIGWGGVAGSLSVPIQLPYAISGVMGGAALVGFAVGLMSVQASRRREAAERAEFGRLVNAAAELLAAARGGRA